MMEKLAPEHQIDPLLLPFLRAKDEADARSHLGRLIELVTPKIKEIVSHSPQSEDAYQETTKQLIEKLQRCRDKPPAEVIENFSHYAARVAGNVCRESLRHPIYRALKDALRHVLRRDPRFALWRSQKNLLCGLAGWSGQPLDFTPHKQLTELLHDPPKLDAIILPKRDAQRVKNAEIVAAVFHWLGHPLVFNDLVRIVCGLKRLKVSTPMVELLDDNVAHHLSSVVCLSISPEDEALWRERLTRLWEEIEQLSRRQRIACLLNFKMANGELDVFMKYGVAGVRRMGKTLQLTDEEFQRVWPELSFDFRFADLGATPSERRCRAEQLTDYDQKFALLWLHLPLEGKIIARLLKTTPGFVAKLRYQANARLVLRLLDLW